MASRKKLAPSKAINRAAAVEGAQLELGTVDAKLEARVEAEPTPPPIAEPTPRPTVAAAVPLAVLEVGRLLPVHLAKLPRPTSLDLEMVAAPKVAAVAFAVTTSASRYRQLRESGRPVLLASEFCALAVAAEHGRASAVWLADRLSHPSSQIELGVALGGAPHRTVDDDRPDWLAPRGRGLWGVIEADFEHGKRTAAVSVSSGGWHLEAWPIARVLYVWGARIVRVGIGEVVEWFE